jgi:hypothetical protein
MIRILDIKPINNSFFPMREYDEVNSCFAFEKGYLTKKRLMTTNQDDVHSRVFMRSEFDYIGIVIYNQHVRIIRGTKYRKDVLCTNINDVSSFIEHEKKSLDPYVMYKFVPATVGNIQYNAHAFDDHIADHILRFVSEHKSSHAKIIQKNVRRWIAKRRFNKDRMYLHIQLASLPPKYVSESFPGGSSYRAAFESFYMNAM